ncbi:MAG: prephenate dehydrogenase/arogenate dehydrogenase family protein [Myxococcota bacterium]
MNLDELRYQLGEVDKQILALAAERQRLAKEIGRAKRAAGKPTRDFVQERQVIDRARTVASSVQLSPALAAALVETLIRHSLAAQEHDIVAAQAAGAGRRALVIGGAGKMGQWFARFLASQEFAVEIADPAGAVEGFACHEEWQSLLLEHELIVIAAPLLATNQILHELAKRPPTGVVFDIGSLKSPVRSGLRALHSAGGHVASIHPMFGPCTDLLSGQHVIFIDLGDAEALAAAKALFEPTMATRIDMELEDHDRLIAYVLGLSHAVNLAFVTALSNSGEKASRLAKLSSTTFDAQLEVARRVAAENPRLYYEIQALNDYGTESLAALLYAVERIRSAVRASDEAAFVQLMNDCHAYATTPER